MSDKHDVFVYFLSAMTTTPENIAEAMNHRFQRITPKYILIYAPEIPEDAVEIKGSDLGELSEVDREWLSDSNLLVLNDYADVNRESVQQNMEQFFADLRHELEEERKNIAKQGENK